MARKGCLSLRGLDSELRQVGGAKVAGSRLSEKMADPRICRGRLKVGEPSGIKIRCLRNKREKHFLWQLLKNLNERAFK